MGGGAGGGGGWGTPLRRVQPEQDRASRRGDRRLRAQHALATSPRWARAGGCAFRACKEVRDHDPALEPLGTAPAPPPLVLSGHAASLTPY